MTSVTVGGKTYAGQYGSTDQRWARPGGSVLSADNTDAVDSHALTASVDHSRSRSLVVRGQQPTRPGSGCRAGSSRHRNDGSGGERSLLLVHQRGALQCQRLLELPVEPANSSTGSRGEAMPPHTANRRPAPVRLPGQLVAETG